MTSPLVINSFSGKYGFLSNFYPCVVTFEGKSYPSTEHAFQAAKTYNPIERNLIALAKTPADAKKLGRKAQLRPDWEQVKDDVMRELLWQKFQITEMRYRLLDTGDAELIEGNHWNDTYWGVCDGKGANRLGQLLMEVRGLLPPSLL